MIHLHYFIFSLGVIMLRSAAERTNASFMNYTEYSLVQKCFLEGRLRTMAFNKWAT